MAEKTYKVQGIFEWFKQFHGKTIRIEGESKNFEILLDNESLPHLLGVQYVNRVNEIRRGRNLYQYISKLSDQAIYNKIAKNNYNKLQATQQRIDTFQTFMENIEKAYIVEQTHQNTQLKSNYLVIQSEDNTFFHLGIHQSKNTYLETYFVRSDIKYFETSQIIEPIKGLYQYNEKIMSFEPFSFCQKEHILEKEEKTMNLYQYFGCKNQEELYRLVENKNPSVRELIDFMNYAKEKIISKVEKIQHKEDMIKYLGSIELPKEDEFSLTFVDSANRVLSHKIFHRGTGLSEIMKQAYHPRARGFFLLSNSTNYNLYDNLYYELKDLNYESLDRMYLKNNEIYSVDLELGGSIGNVSEEKENTFLFSETFTNVSSIPKMEKYQEFIEYYREQQLPGKNVIANHREIEKLLKLSNQHLSQEYFSIIPYDKNNKITNYETLFKGTVNSAPVDLKVLIPYLLDENIKGIQILHNHPSGIPKPSRKDIELTRDIESLCKKFNKELLDHTIVGKEDIFSFQREGMLYQNVLAQGVAEINEPREMIEALKDDIENLQYANDSMRGNKEIAKFIIPENPSALRHMTEELRNDKELVLQAIQKNGKMFEYASEVLRDDKDVAYEALKKDKANVLYLGDTIGKKIQEEKDLEIFLQEYAKEKEKQLEEAKQIKTDKLYIYEDKKLISVEELSTEGYRNAFLLYKEKDRENRSVPSSLKFEMFGITEKGELYLTGIDQTDTSYTLEEACERFHQYGKISGERNQKMLPRMIHEIDQKYEVNMAKVYQEITGHEIAEPKIQEMTPQKEIEQDKIYAYILEGKNEKGEELTLIAEDTLTKEGIANVYKSSKELYEKGLISKVKIFGIDSNGIVYHGRPDQRNFDLSKGEYAKNLISGSLKVNLLESRQEYILDKIKEIDKQYHVGMLELYQGITNVRGNEVMQQSSRSKKEMEKEEKIVGVSNSKKEGQKIMQQIMEEAKVSKPSKYKEEREKFTDSVIKSLEEGKIPWERDWESKSSILHNPISQTKYQGKNAFKLAVTSFKKGYTDPRWVTFKQAQQAGWKVKKGEKATTIEIYQKYDKATKKEFDEKVLEGMSYAEKSKYMKENVYFFIKTHNVFNGQQLEGIAPFKEEKREVKYEKIDKILQNSKVPVQYLGNKAFYSIETDSITLPEKENFKSENRFYGTALHELAHSTGHKNRLNRNIDSKFGTKQYAREELVAEFSSVFIGQQLGLNYDKDKLDNSKAYLQNWAKHLKEDKNLLYDAIKDAEIATKSIVAMQTKEGPEIFKQHNHERQFLKGKKVEKENGMER
ncbi:PF04002 family protein [Fusobacterium necrophorum subsp. funduliforme ATCC 51357]|uniref:DNA repair protein RadC n=1 Tax=Fusobacterium gonidiaformans 3-1-5R TaxID=469605 RepID=E5BI39_9FUSO|nr:MULTISPECIES: zincin-like metallopeptidase domain-containing protein [Fusobacterium]EFS22162.1 DNA repair protein RadC [Fusobacterium gonidiaformans 3-1-5R]EIJ68671.1 PF04002 family protein [Fusobacterium necrophorum subsp. funduliforme ATCC 51357]KAB0552951.1 DUF1738 domain-containing protein [Fusobacterium necrophorum subsp. funduliforme]